MQRPHCMQPPTLMQPTTGIGVQSDSWKHVDGPEKQKLHLMLQMKKWLVNYGHTQRNLQESSFNCKQAPITGPIQIGLRSWHSLAPQVQHPKRSLTQKMGSALSAVGLYPKLLSREERMAWLGNHSWVLKFETVACKWEGCCRFHGL